MDGIGTPGGGAGGGIKHVGVMTMEPGSYRRLRDTSIRAGIMEEWLRFTYELFEIGSASFMIWGCRYYPIASMECRRAQAVTMFMSPSYNSTIPLPYHLNPPS
jgi:hypothetical protein